MAQDKGKARRAASNRITNKMADKRANTINRSILGPVGNKAARAYVDAGKTALRGVKTTQRASQNVLNEAYKKARTKPTKNLSDAAQFGGKAAQSIIKEAQGRLKMVMKGFGN